MPRNWVVKVLLMILFSKDFRRLYSRNIEVILSVECNSQSFGERFIEKIFFKVCVSLDVTFTNSIMTRTQDTVSSKIGSWFIHSCLLTCVSCSPRPSLARLSADRGIVGKYCRSKRTRALHNNRGEGSTVRCMPLVIQLYGFCDSTPCSFLWPYIKGITQS